MLLSLYRVLVMELIKSTLTLVSIKFFTECKKTNLQEIAGQFENVVCQRQLLLLKKLTL
jgi:hypothetical protein